MSDDETEEMNREIAALMSVNKALALALKGKGEELAEWKQAAGVEAGLRREFLARAEAAESSLAQKGEECERDRKQYDDWTDEIKGTIEHWKSEVAAAESSLSRMKEALESIAKNICCDRCQEAALVARSALSQSVDFGEPQRESNAQTLSSETECFSRNEWRDIKTAPKDREFLAYTSTGCCWIVVWDGTGPHPGWHDAYAGQPLGLITHWMQLPSPPTDKEVSELTVREGQVPRSSPSDTACYNNGLKVLGVTTPSPETEEDPAFVRAALQSDIDSLEADNERLRAAIRPIVEVDWYATGYGNKFRGAVRGEAIDALKRLSLEADNQRLRRRMEIAHAALMPDHE